MTDQPLTVAQFADRLQLHKITVQRWLRDGRLRGAKLPGKAGWRIPPAEVERLERGEARQAIAYDRTDPDRPE